MPAPAQTSLGAIVRAGRDLVESRGLSALTMQAVAEAVGVRAPSIYKRLRDRNELIRLVTEAIAEDLRAVLDGATFSSDARTDLRILIDATREFAHRHPQGYALLYAPLPEPARPDGEVLARASVTLLCATTALVGEEQALPAARTIVSWLHGFVTMELAGAFRLDGDVDAAFDFGADRIVDVVASG